MPAVPGKPTATSGVAATMRSALRTFLIGTAALVMLAFSGCSSGSEDSAGSTADTTSGAQQTLAGSDDTLPSDIPESPTAPVATPQSTATPTPTSTPVPLPVNQSGEWDLVFGDEFDSIDPSIWETGWFSSTGFSPSVNETGAACFHPDQLRVADGSLVITVEEETSADCRLKGDIQANYVAGLMNTRESFTFTYGYTEARMFLASNGDQVLNWPAFWHTGFDWPRTGEIDVAEGLSGGELCSVYHHEGADGEQVQERGCVDWDDPGGWHVFAAKWEPDRISYYYDGIEIFVTTTGVVDSPHYLVVDYTVRNDGSAQVPSELLVDYIRVWQARE